MTKRPVPWDGQVDVISSDDSLSSDTEMETDGGTSGQQRSAEFLVNRLADARLSEGTIPKIASMYQEYMKKVPIPSQRGSVIPCNTWMDLAKSIKELYGQPLHYLTNVLVKQWDQARFETGDDCQPLDTIVHPLKAEATIWLIEEVHRRTASYLHLTKLWEHDPMYSTFVDSILAKI